MAIVGFIKQILIGEVISLQVRMHQDVRYLMRFDVGLSSTVAITHPLTDLEAEACVVGDGGSQKGGGAPLLLACHDLGEGHAGVVVDSDMDELPTHASAVALAGPVAGYAMSDPVEQAELLDVDMDHLARLLALVTAHRCSRLKSGNLTEPQALEDAAESGRRDTEFGRDLLTREALAAQQFDPIDDGLRRRSIEPVRPRGAILWPGQAFGPISINQFTCGSLADACGSCGGLRRLPAPDLPHNPLSTRRREPGILMDVHPVLRENHEASGTSASSVRAGWTTY